MGDIIVRSSQTGLAINNGPSVLGERQARIPVGGKIRAGIKVLTSNAKKHPDAQAIYDAGVKVGKKWDVIEKELRDRTSPIAVPSAFCRWLIDLSISSIAVWNLREARS